MDSDSLCDLRQVTFPLWASFPQSSVGQCYLRTLQVLKVLGCTAFRLNTWTQILVTVYAWTSYLTSACLSLLIYKMGTGVLPTSEGYCEYQMINACKALSTQPSTQ